MSIVTDFRSRAEDALEQGKQALETAQKTAHTRFTEAVGTVSSVAEKTVSRDVSVAGRTVSFETLVADLEQLVKRYRDSASERVADLKADERISGLVDRAEAILSEVKSDKRVTHLVGRAESVYDALFETVQGLVVNPTKDLISKSPIATKTHKPAASKPAATKPVATTPVATTPVATTPTTTAPTTTAPPAKKAAPATKAAAKPVTATSVAAKKPAKTAARKAPAKDTTGSTSA